MRITGGFARGYPIKVPGSISDLRPSQDVVRQAVFNWLASHFEFQNPKVLDLFAGTGAFGLEALSRGAKHCVFVDHNRKACQTLEKALLHSMFLGKTKVVCKDAIRFVSEQARTSYNLIFLDPPYTVKLPKLFFDELADLLTPGGVLIYSHAKATTVLPNLDQLELADTRRYGNSSISFLTKVGKSGRMANQ